jgi:transcription-repair coupling factor (superfamily II helicase)
MPTPPPSSAADRGTAAVTQPDLSLLEQFGPLAELVQGLLRGRSRRVGNLWGSSQALLLAGLAARWPRCLLAVTSTEAEAEALAEDLVQFGARPFLLPARGSDERGAHADLEGLRERLRFAQAAVGPAAERPRLVLAPLLGLLQPLPGSQALTGQLAELAVGQRLDLSHLLQKLIGAGYTRQPLVERPGEVSLRGDVLDVFGFAAEAPLRIELFDSEVESLRSFDAETQRSVEKLERAAILLAADPGGIEDGQGVPPVSLLPKDTLFVELEPLRIEDQREGLRVRSTSHARALDEYYRELSRHPLLQLQSLPTSDLDLDGKSVQQLAVGLPNAGAALAELGGQFRHVWVFCRTSAERDRFERLLEAGPRPAGLELWIGALQKGFRLPSLGLVAVNHHELAGTHGLGGLAKQKKPAHRVRSLQSFFELKVGDLVVHSVHGLARYLGLKRMARGGGEEEHLHLEFAEEVSLYVPASRIDLVQRYIGTGSALPKLDKLGGGTFKKRKEKVEQALMDLAAELLEVQAKRELQQRTPWRGEPNLVAEMLAAFPYTDTPDQASADADIAADLSAEKPMDRLLCGDVGFGKTEVAIRAAFRVVAAGGQVAVLVPTTVLADQHYETFRARLAGFPVRIEALSRMNRPAEVKAILSAVATGQVDILIGTHRILSEDVGWKRLGLVVVDEEQRFGVKHKEHFKGLRATVDILTLSATPIPRTLHMSLSGVRDISALSVPPRGRQDVETKLINRDDLPLIREVLLREKERGGQVFFLHNTVADLPAFTRELAALVPECRFEYGHGQMTARELWRVMHRFAAHELDVLVATTIIENGIDIPAAGTILIDRADEFGLSELHQLRGRVGRNSQASWCYLLVDRTKPLRSIAKERLKALEELSHLGAGFQISMKDLEIRGAGNLLGPEQSGHIAAVGYDMYCRLLKQTVEQLRSGAEGAGLPVRGELSDSVELELALEAYLPEDWIASADERLQILRRMDAVRSHAETLELELALRDQFGRLPAPARMLLRQFRLRAALLPLTITRVSWRDDCFLIEFSDRVAIEQALAGAKVELRPLRPGVALVMLPKRVASPRAGLDWLERLLGLPPLEPEPAA